MTEPAYVAIAGDYARRIRTGEIPPGTRLPSYADMAEQNGVSDIVVRKAIDLLQSQGLVRSVRRKGVFVSDGPRLIRVSPERQLEDPEETFQAESSAPIEVERQVERVEASAELAEAFGVEVGDTLIHTITRVAEGRRHVSISDTYQPIDVTDLAAATLLEETVSDRLPPENHAGWLLTVSGDLVKCIHQRFITADGRLIMLSDISYPRDRYDGYMFRMALTGV
jgi:GntR family transcriptional regulator